MTSRFLWKPLIAFLVFFSAGAFYSCSDDEIEPTLQANIFLSGGEWNASSYVIGGQESIGSVNMGLVLKFTTDGDVGGTYQGTTIDNNGNSSGIGSSYEVVNEGKGLKFGSDTLLMTVSSSSLNLDGRYFLSDVQIIATR